MMAGRWVLVAPLLLLSGLPGPADHPVECPGGGLADDRSGYRVEIEQAATTKLTSAAAGFSNASSHGLLLRPYRLFHGNRSLAGGDDACCGVGFGRYHYRGDPRQ